jgi:transposase
MGKKAVSVETKWQVIGMHKLNVSNREIGRRLNISEFCVRTTIKNFEASGSVNDKPRSGRPRKLSTRDENMLYTLSRRNPKAGVSELSAQINDSLVNKTVSRTTISKLLREKDLNSYHAARKPLLTFTDRQKRKKWCRERLNWSVQRWRMVIFSDESNFEIANRKSKTFVRRKNTEKYLQQHLQSRIQKGGGSVGIWGCISGSGVGCHEIYEGRLNQYRYRDILENALAASRDLFEADQDWLFQQDNAPCHTAHSITEYFAGSNVQLMPWPARSPDLNPIENLWSWMDYQLTKKQITSLEMLKTELTKLWLEIPIKMIENLIESMPRRLAACIKNNGGHIPY